MPEAVFQICDVADRAVFIGLVILALPVAYEFARAVLARSAGRRLRRGHLWRWMLLVVGTAFAAQVLQLVLEQHVINAAARCSREPGARILINSRPVASQREWLGWVGEITDIKPHDSRPLERVPVELECGSETVRLELAKDSRIPTDLWVFSPEFTTTSLNRIAVIQVSDAALHDLDGTPR
jgi:hypothetical protein